MAKRNLKAVAKETAQPAFESPPWKAAPPVSAARETAQPPALAGMTIRVRTGGQYFIRPDDPHDMPPLTADEAATGQSTAPKE